MLGKDYEAQSNCVNGAVKDFISYYDDDDKGKELCDSLEADMREVCFEAAEEYSKKRRGIRE